MTESLEIDGLTRGILVILPTHSDPNYPEKQQLIERVGSNSKRPVIFASSFATESGFEFVKFLEVVREAEIILIDLSLERPSCYYELGIVEALGRTAFLVAKSGTPLHQLRDREAVCFYDSNADLELILSERCRDYSNEGCLI